MEDGGSPASHFPASSPGMPSLAYQVNRVHYGSGKGLISQATVG